RRALGSGAHGGRDLHPLGGALLDEPVAARSGAAGAAALRRRARHVRAALAGPAQPDRHDRGATVARPSYDPFPRSPPLPPPPRLLHHKPYLASTDGRAGAVVGWHAARE